MIERLDQRLTRRIEQLRERYPRIREDSEYFIYDLTDRNGKHLEMHTPKWVHIPIQVGPDTIVRVPVWDVIETEFETRHLYGDDFSIVKALRDTGRLHE
jgi:hypothetical protein